MPTAGDTTRHIQNQSSSDAHMPMPQTLPHPILLPKQEVLDALRRFAREYRPV